jgi:hypothetical protein
MSATRTLAPPPAQLGRVVSHAERAAGTGRAWVALDDGSTCLVVSELPVGARVAVSPPRRDAPEDPRLVLARVEEPVLPVGGAPGLVQEPGRLVVRCGKASIELHEDGRVVLRGRSILQRSTGPIRIKGASVDIN